MQNREFEKRMQQKMEELKLAPADAVWEKVEAGLPPEKKRRPWVIFILLFCVLVTGSILLWNKFNVNHLKTSKNNLAAQENTAQNTGVQNIESNNKQLADDNGAVKNNSLTTTTTTINTSKKNITASSAKTKIKIKNTTSNQSDNVAGEDLVINNYKQLKTAGSSKISIKAPVQSAEENEKLTEIVVYNEDAGEIKNIVKTDTGITTLINDSLIVEYKETKSDSLVALKKDTAKTNKVNLKKKDSNKLKWTYGFEFAGGVSAVKNNLFSNAPVFSDANAAYTSGPPNPQVRAAPNNPSKGAAFGFGFYMERAINEKWKFSTGINYFYQNNFILVGKKVDTPVTVRLDAFKDLSTNNYYSSGNSSTYKNKYHLLEIPLLFHYQFSKKSPVYFKTGLTAAYLLQSNALVYNSNSSAYITDKSIFNRALLSVNIGTGIDLAKKTKLPFSIGYQFKYSIGSVTKTTFGKQHFVNSLLYLKIPIKK
jgi:Outer membrane protein beta-barrel domain